MKLSGEQATDLGILGVVCFCALMVCLITYTLFTGEPPLTSYSGMLSWVPGVPLHLMVRTQECPSYQINAQSCSGSTELCGTTVKLHGANALACPYNESLENPFCPETNYVMVSSLQSMGGSISVCGVYWDEFSHPPSYQSWWIVCEKQGYTCMNCPIYFTPVSLDTGHQEVCYMVKNELVPSTTTVSTTTKPSTTTSTLPSGGGGSDTVDNTLTYLLIGAVVLGVLFVCGVYGVIKLKK